MVISILSVTTSKLPLNQKYFQQYPEEDYYQIQEPTLYHTVYPYENIITYFPAVAPCPTLAPPDVRHFPQLAERLGKTLYPHRLLL